MAPADLDLIAALNQAVERAVAPIARELQDFKEQWRDENRNAADSRKEIHKQQTQQTADIAVLGERVAATRTKVDEVGLAVTTLQLDVARALDKGEAAAKDVADLEPRVDALTTFKNEAKGATERTTFTFNLVRLVVGVAVGVASTLAAMWGLLGGSHAPPPPHP